MPRNLSRKVRSWLPGKSSPQPKSTPTPILVSLQPISTIDLISIIPSSDLGDKLEKQSSRDDPHKSSTQSRNLCKSRMLSFWSLYGGIIMSLSASVFFSVAFLIIKILERHGVKAFGASLLFNLGVLIPCSFLIVINEFGPGWENRARILQGIWPLNKESVLWFMMIQGILQAASVIFRSLSLRYLSVGDMTVIVFSSPVVTTILAHFIVGEKIGWIFILIAIFTLCGVGCVTKPPIITGAKEFDTASLIGSGFAAGAMLTLSMKFVVTRKIKDTHFLAMTFFLGFAGTVASLPLFFIFESPSSLIPTTAMGGLLEVGLLSAFGAVASINLALKIEDAGVVALVRSCDVICAFMLQFIFLGVVPDLLSAIGALMVWTGVLVAGIMKYWNDRQDKKKQALNHDLTGVSKETVCEN